MSEFLVESPHTKSECMQVLDETLAKGSNVLSKFQWGCASGDHRAWAFIKANSPSQARSVVPSSVRGKARITKVSKFSRKQIESMHNM